MNKLSEIAGRAGKDANHITEPLSRLKELGYIKREIPFGENEKKSKKGLYKVQEPFLAFHYKFIAPNRSYIEMGRGDVIENLLGEHFSEYVGLVWGSLCRDFVSGSTINGVIYQMAHRWWGKIMVKDKDGKDTPRNVEIDVVAESFDKKHILLGECKWTNGEDTVRLTHKLQEIIPKLPFVKKQQIHLCYFLKSKPVRQQQDVSVYYPEDVLVK